MIRGRSRGRGGVEANWEEEEVNKVDDDMGRYGQRDKVGNLGGRGGRYDS